MVENGIRKGVDLYIGCVYVPAHGNIKHISTDRFNLLKEDICMIKDRADTYERNPGLRDRIKRDGLGSSCPGISGTAPDFKNLSRVLECFVNSPGRVLTHVVLRL